MEVVVLAEEKTTEMDEDNVFRITLTAEGKIDNPDVLNDGHLFSKKRIEVVDSSKTWSVSSDTLTNLRQHIMSTNTTHFNRFVDPQESFKACLRLFELSYTGMFLFCFFLKP